MVNLNVWKQNKEVENLNFSTIKVKNKGQQTITSQWLLTQKGKHSGQKIKVKARIVARNQQNACRQSYHSKGFA